jgi:hypothetical protein
MVAELVNTYHDDELIIPGKVPISPELAAEIKARARIRDVPASCQCRWHYISAAGRWYHIRWIDGCQWHLHRT